VAVGNYVEQWGGLTSLVFGEGELMSILNTTRSALLGTTALVAVIATGAGTAVAGGFAVREQSTESQGASFAGSAAMGGGIGSMFWNPAATANKPGFNTESNYALIIPDAEVHTKGGTAPQLGLLGSDSGSIAGLAIVPASYMTYQMKNYDPNLFIGLGINSPFGLTTEPDNNNYKGAVLGRTSHLFTVNLNPTLAYRVTPEITVGLGAQIMYASGQFKFALVGAGGTLIPGSAGFEGDSITAGATAGINFAPAPGTNIGLGYRSRMTEKLEGQFFSPVGAKVDGTVDVKLPDIVTLSLRQSIAPNMRLLGTVEYTSWSVFDELRVKRSVGTDVVIDAKWSDSWLFSVGGEYDVNRALTLRTGFGYEISPVDDPTKRIVGIPDSDRVWASIGASYKWSDATTIDFAYTHIFLQDAELNRLSQQNLRVVADIEAKTDILSVALKTKW
jgi:long-chain fatty acid transport protein